MPSLLRLALVIALPLVLLVSPLYVFVTPGFVRYEYATPSFPSADRFGDAERLRLSDVIVNYLRGRAGAQDMAAMRTSAGDVAMRDSEVAHIVDVRRVMDGFFVAHGVAVLVALLSVLGLGLSTRRALLPHALRQGVWVTAAIILLIVVASLIDFDAFFTRFHQLFFTGESWLFYVDDTLIQLYPPLLWMDAVWKIGVFVLGELALVYAVAWGLGRASWLRGAA
jgi:integral membrane protein (TIGR01906 family)